MNELYCQENFHLFTYRRCIVKEAQDLDGAGSDQLSSGALRRVFLLRRRPVAAGQGRRCPGPLLDGLDEVLLTSTKMKVQINNGVRRIKIAKSALIGAWKCNLAPFWEIMKYRPTDQPSNRRAYGARREFTLKQPTNQSTTNGRL